MKRLASGLASLQYPALKAGCPQQVWPRGKSHVHAEALQHPDGALAHLGVELVNYAGDEEGRLHVKWPRRDSSGERLGRRARMAWSDTRALSVAAKVLERDSADGESDQPAHHEDGTRGEEETFGRVVGWAVAP